MYKIKYLFNVYVYGTIGIVEYMDKVDNVLPYIIRSRAIREAEQKSSSMALTQADDMIECTSRSNKIVSNVTVSQNKEV